MSRPHEVQGGAGPDEVAAILAALAALGGEEKPAADLEGSAARGAWERSADDGERAPRPRVPGRPGRRRGGSEG